MQRAMYRRNCKFHLMLALVCIGLYGFTQTYPSVFAQSDVPITTPTPVATTPDPTETPIVTTLSPTPTTQREDLIRAVISVKTQSPWNKKIPITLSITPTISGEKLEVRWQRRAGLVADPILISVTQPQAGKTYTASFELTPFAVGYQRAVADIILTTRTTNYVVSKDVTLQFNQDKTVIPITPMYIFYQVVMYALIIGFFFIALPFGIFKSALYLKNTVIPKWLESKVRAQK